MADLSKNLEQGVEGEEIMRVLFGQEFWDSAEDRFEGSKDEHKIFEEVFYKASAEDAKLGNTHANPSATATLGGLASRYSLKDSSGKEYDPSKMSFKGTSAFEPHENVPSVLLGKSASFSPKEASNPIIYAQQSTRKPTNLNTIDASIEEERNPKRELPCRLESYAHRLLLDAGWKVELRQRNDRQKPAHFFINTEERLICKSLTVAWKACGERLLASAPELERDDNGREWWDFDSFWGDMNDTMDYIDKVAHHQESSLSLLRRWQLIDPFMATMWIDRKLNSLRKGMGVKAVKSKAMVLKKDGEEKGNEAVKNAEEVSLCLEEENCSCCERSQKKCLRSFGKRTGKALHNVKRLHMGSTGSGSQSKKPNVSSSKSTSMQRADLQHSDHDENKHLNAMEEMSNLGANDSCGQTMTQPEMQCIAYQANQHDLNTTSILGNNLICSTVCQVFSSLPQETSSIAEEMVVSAKTKSKLKRIAIMSAESSAKKTRKKSKKISEIGETELANKGMDTELHDGSCGEGFASHMDDKTNKELDHTCFQKETSLTSELSSECLQRVVLFKHHSPRTEEMCAPKKVKVHQKPVKSETKVTRQSGKKKGNAIMSSVDEHGNALSEEVLQYHKPSKGKCKGKRLSSSEFSSVSLKEEKVALEFSTVCEHLGVLADNEDIPQESVSKEICDEVLSTASGTSFDHGSNQKIAKANKSSDFNKQKGQKKFQKCRINDDDLLIAAIIKKKDFGSHGKRFASKAGPTQMKALRKLKSQKGSCKLLPRAPKRGGNNSVDGRRITLATRTDLCWLIEMGALSFKDVIQYRNPKNNDVIKDGWVTSEGILCKCCTKIFSLSDFKAHAGLKQQRSSLNLFVQSGKPYTLCQLQAWSVEFKKRKNNLQLLGSDEKDANDDTCGLCGDGGDLICCDNCPSTYHQTCLSAQELPEGNWYCPNCICVACKDLVSGRETSGTLAGLECAQCEHKYHKACIQGKMSCAGERGPSIWFCGKSCQEVYLGLRARVGAVNYIADGFSWTVLRCAHDDQKICSTQKIALMAECNTKLSIALNLMEECFLPMVDPRTGIDMIPHVLYNLGSPFSRLNYQGFYAVVLEKGDQLISVASIRVHGAEVAEMPLIATCSEHRRQGMCRRLLNAIEKMLISFKVKILVLSAIPSLVETWTSGFGFKPVGQEEKQELTNVNLMLFPGTTFLIKNLLEASAAQESAENIDSCSREQNSPILGDSVESANAITGHRRAESHRSDMDANSIVPNALSPRLEQASDQQGEAVTYSSENYVLTARQGEHGVVSNAESCLSVTTSNINEMDHIFSTQRFVSCHNNPVANTSVVVHDCSGIFTPTTTNEENSTSPTHTIQERTPINISIHTEDNANGAMSDEGTTPFEDEEVARRIITDDLRDKDGVTEKPYTATAHDEVSNALSSNKTTAAATRHVECNTSQNANKFSESSVDETMKYQTNIFTFVRDVERQNPASEGNDGSDELVVGNTSMAVPDVNDMSLEMIDDKGEVGGDDSSNASKDEICGFMGKHSVAERCTTESVEA